MEKFKFLEHPAELKIRSRGKNLPELFINSALGMMSYIYKVSPKKIDNIINNKIEIHSQNLEALLIDWLSEILCLSDINKQAYISFKIIEFTPNKIIAEVGSVKAKARDDIKAVTYHELAISEKNNFWEAMVVYDI